MLFVIESGPGLFPFLSFLVASRTSSSVIGLLMNRWGGGGQDACVVGRSHWNLFVFRLYQLERPGTHLCGS